MTTFMALPFPPSVNRIWRQWKGRTLLSKEGRQYREQVARLVVLERPETFGRRKVRIDFMAYMPDKRRRDIDNLVKAANDALQAARVFEDDSQIVDLRIRNAGVDRDNPRLEVRLEAA